MLLASLCNFFYKCCNVQIICVRMNNKNFGQIVWMHKLHSVLAISILESTIQTVFYVKTK